MTKKNLCYNTDYRHFRNEIKQATHKNCQTQREHPPSPFLGILFQILEVTDYYE
jgi:hypothetical protein